MWATVATALTGTTTRTATAATPRDGFQALCPYWEGTGSAFHAAPGSTKGCLFLSLIFMFIFTLQLIVCKGKVPKWAGRFYLVFYAGYILYQILAAFIGSVLIFILPWYFAI